MEAKNLCRYLWSTMKADLPNAMHRDAWKKFKENLRLRDCLALVVGLSNEVIRLILGVDSATRRSNFMEDDENEAKMMQSYVEYLPIIAIIDRVLLLMLGAILIISFKYHRISEAIFYVGVVYMMFEALLELPGNVEWYMNPSTRLVTMIFSFIDKSLLQSVCVLIFWAV